MGETVKGSVESVIDFGSGGVNVPERRGSTGPLINFGSGVVRETEIRQH